MLFPVLIVNEHGVIRAITHTSPGRTHDLTQIRQSGVLDDIPIHVGVVGDAGYTGLHNDLPNHSVATAHKAQRGHPLEQAHKDINRELSSGTVKCSVGLQSGVGGNYPVSLLRINSQEGQLS